MKPKLFICLILLCSTCVALEDANQAVATIDTEPELRSELGAFKPFLGTWVINAKLKDGRPLRARTQYKAGLNGNFVIVDMFAKHEDGEEYRQYHTLWRWDQKNKAVVAHRFKHDGTYDRAEVTVATGGEGRPAMTTLFISPGSPVAVQQTIQLMDEKSYNWKISTSVTRENPIMEGVWKKQE